MTSFYNELITNMKGYGRQPAVIDHQGVLSFDELRAGAESLNEHLKNAGITPGMAIGIVADNGRDFLISLCAIMGRGAVAFPISPQLHARETNLLAREVGLHGWLTDGTTIGLEASASTQIHLPGHSLSYCWRQASRTANIAPHISEPAVVRFTSGTTGQAKGVVLSHSTLLARTAVAQRGLELREGQRALWVLPMSYHFAVSCLTYLRFGITTVVSPDLLASSLLDAAEKHQPDFLYCAPLHIRMLAAEGSGRPLASVKRVISTSATLPTSVSRQFEQRFHQPVEQVYGMIELGLPLRSSGAGAGFGPISPEMEACLVDGDNFTAPRGQLALRGPGLFDGYLAPARTTQEVLHKGWLLTGDLAERREDGSLLLIGRLKSMINVAGNKVFPEEVEAVLDQHPAVEDCLVYGQSHPILGEVVAAEVVPKEGLMAEAETLIKHCRSHLSAFKVPSQIHLVPAVARTATGKRCRSRRFAESDQSLV